MENMENKEIEIGEKYLPIGTVVMLKGGSKRVMITGFCTIAQEHQDKLFDYSGCIYPEGFIESNQVCLFDHAQIEKVYHLGLIDNEEREFKQKLTTAINTIGEDNLLKINNEMTDTMVEAEPQVQTEEATSEPAQPTTPEVSVAPQMPTASEIPTMPAE